MRKWRKLGLRPFHNSKGVLGTDLEGTTFKIYTVVCNAYPQKVVGNDE